MHKVLLIIARQNAGRNGIAFKLKDLYGKGDLFGCVEGDLKTSTSHDLWVVCAIEQFMNDLHDHNY